jgi:hypothetical protein
MTKRNPKDEAVQNEVKQFVESVFQLKLRYSIYQELFEDTHARCLMEIIAHHFFYDIGSVLIDYLLL